MSSDDFAIRVEGLSKCYQIYEKPSDRLRQFISPRLRYIFRQQARQYHRDFWALRDISFEVKRGDTVGMVGRNGSGKSTLLQIICGTLTPTAGTVEVKGRVAALLELGAGFNPEFSGRENVYMNAALLGLTRQQTDERFDKIAAFADIGDFINQPVKTYSSGMYVRLAFAVIAHVDADIMVVDEALAVGDAVFTQKCMRFIRRFQESGTLLFVSHDMGAVQNLCRSALWLGHGELKQAGTSKQVVESYLRYTLQETYGNSVLLDQTGETNVDEIEESHADVVPVLQYGALFTTGENIQGSKGWKTGGAEIKSIALNRLSDGAASPFEGGERVKLIMNAIALQDLDSPILGFVVRDRLGQDLFGENTLSFTSLVPRPVKAGRVFEASFTFRLPMLPNGEYAVMASVADGHQYDNTQHHYMHDALIINVASSRVRFGLVGVPFESVSLELVGNSTAEN